MTAAFICPFKIDRLTGTPVRARTVIDCVSHFAETNTISSIGQSEDALKFSLRAFRTLNQIKPDAIHGFSTLSVIPMLAYKILHPKIKMIFELHGWSWFETMGQMNILKRIIFLLLDIIGYMLSNHVILMSYTQKEYLAKTIYPRAVAQVIWGAVDFPITFDESEDRDGIVVGYQGNDSWWQGLHVLIEVAVMLKDNPSISFQLVGFDSSDHTKFPHLPNIKYVEKFGREDVPVLIKQCDVMVSPRMAGRVSELQYPQKLSVYLSAGRPVIVSDTSDQALVIKRSGAGVVVSQLTPETLSQSIVDFAQLSLEKRREMARRATQFAQENFSLKAFGEKLKDIYKKS